MDDLFILSEDAEQNTKCTKCVLQFMKDLGLHLKIKKCKFGVSEINYLGHILRPGEITMDLSKLDRIKNWPILNSLTQLHSFWIHQLLLKIHRQLFHQHLNIN